LLEYDDKRPSILGSLLIVASVLALAAFNKNAPPPSHRFGAPRSRAAFLLRQLMRAKEPGRGREATSPAHIPWKGWKDIFWRTAS